VTVIVLADDALSQIKAGQERKGYAVTGTTFGPIDYAKLGDAFGIEASVVRTVEECRDAFRATPRGRPMLVAARIDPAGYRVD
jgi:thiamine pyrophosphate-dependent acetolactate synthase large subunit-like protein